MSNWQAIQLYSKLSKKTQKSPIPQICDSLARIWILFGILSILHILNFKFGLRKVVNLHETSNYQLLVNLLLTIH